MRAVKLCFNKIYQFLMAEEEGGVPANIFVTDGHETFLCLCAATNLYLIGIFGSLSVNTCLHQHDFAVCFHMCVTVTHDL